MTSGISRLHWQANSGLELHQESLLRDPARVAVAVAGVVMIVCSVLPWARGYSVAGPVWFVPTQGTGDGLLIAICSVLMITFTLRRSLVESHSRSVQLLAPAVAVTAAALWISGEQSARFTVQQWLYNGWTAWETEAVQITLAASLVAVVATLWIEVHRPGSQRAATSSLWTEWQLTESGLIQGILGFIGGVLGAAAGLAIGVEVSGGWALGALLFVLLCVPGLIFGAQLGIWIGRLIGGRLERR
jgi:hypothetical protein